MRTVAWTAALELGVAELDDDHRVMLALLNRLLKAGSRMEGGAVLQELGRFTAEHFEREERLMLTCGYEFADRHGLEHRELYQEIRHQIDDLAAGERELPEVALFMQRWLLRHIVGEDLRLAQAIRERLGVRAANGLAGAYTGAGSASEGAGLCELRESSREG